MTDYTKIIEGLVPKLDGESAVRHRSAVVTAVNGDGTVDLDFNGSTVPNVSVLIGASAIVGNTVQVAVWAGDMLVLGANALTAGQTASVSAAGANTSGARTFTNTTYQDLDALTGGAGSLGFVRLTIFTGTQALVTASADALFNSGGITLLSYRVSGATTTASSDTFALRNGATTQMGGSSQHLAAVNAGANTFELQARVTGGTGTLGTPRLHVIAV